MGKINKLKLLFIIFTFLYTVSIPTASYLWATSHIEQRLQQSQLQHHVQDLEFCSTSVANYVLQFIDKPEEASLQKIVAWTHKCRAYWAQAIREAPDEAQKKQLTLARDLFEHWMDSITDILNHRVKMLEQENEMLPYPSLDALGDYIKSEITLEAMRSQLLVDLSGILASLEEFTR